MTPAPPSPSSPARTLGPLRALAELDRQLQPALPAGIPHLPAAEERLAAGIPALHEEPIVDGATMRYALSAVARVLESEPDVAAAHRAAQWMSLEPEFASVAVAAALAAEWEPIESAATRSGFDPHASVAVADYAVRPWLRLAAADVAPLVAATAWQRGYCPACGALPVLAELRGATRERFLRCVRCSSGWPFPRLACPACGERRHQQMRALHAEGESEYRRADTCDSCRSYLKSIAVLEPLGPVALLETDLATSALDFAAIDRGYGRLRLTHS